MTTAQTVRVRSPTQRSTGGAAATSPLVTTSAGGASATTTGSGGSAGGPLRGTWLRAGLDMVVLVVGEWGDEGRDATGVPPGVVSRAERIRTSDLLNPIQEEGARSKLNCQGDMSTDE